MAKKYKKSIGNLMWVLISAIVIIGAAVIMILVMRQSNEVGLTAWDKIKNLNPFA